MLAFYSALARRLYGARALLWVLVALGVGGFVAALLLSTGTSYLLLALCLALWSVCLLVIVHTFVHPVVAGEAAGEEGFLAGLRVRLARALRWLLAWGMTGLCAAVLVASVRAAVLVLRGAGS